MGMLHITDKRVLMGASVGAVVVLLLSLVALSHVFASSKAPAPRQIAAATVAATATAQATATATIVPTATATQPPRKPTATPKPQPLPVPKNAPPPVNTGGLGQPTPGPAPTHTTQPTPTPCAGSTACVNVTPTPAGACQPGGPPYYSTPTVTPTTATIAQTISTAASRNGIPVALQEAIAWQESGWQQNVIACDGGIGLMQLMPATVSWLNSYYGVNDNPYDLAGNAGLGAGYLAFYYSYYTGYLQQNSPAACGSAGCNWDTIWPGSASAANPQGTTVRDIIISVYNEGAGTMANYGIINWSYVSNVLSFYQQRYGGTGN